MAELGRGWIDVSAMATGESFPEAKVVHLPKFRSDHCPVLVKLQPTISNTRINPPFRFQAMWMHHAEYADFVKQSWKNSGTSLLNTTSIIATELNDWNKNVFGNIFKQKRRLLAGLGGVQRCRCQKDNNYLGLLESDLIKQYEDFRDKEALLWKQKSREKWVQDGDRNTKFFHLTTMI